MRYKTKWFKLTIVLALGFTVACASYFLPPFSFGGEEVIEVELMHLEPPLVDSVQKREVLAKDRINEFYLALNRSKHQGASKVRTPYLIKCKLKSGGTWELKASDEMVSDRDKDDYYAFEGGAEFLRRFFPKFFE